MKYEAIGQNRDTGARMVLTFEAESKAAAERKARSAGMDVRSIREADGTPTGVVEGGSRRRTTGIHPLIKLLALAILLAVAIYFTQPLWAELFR